MPTQMEHGAPRYFVTRVKKDPAVPERYRRAGGKIGPLVSSEVVLRHFQISRWTLRNWRLRGCPHYRPGQYRYRLSEVEAWAAEQEWTRKATPVTVTPA